MEPTRRWWRDAALVVILAGSAIVFEQFLLVVGAAGLCGFLLVAQYEFFRTLSRLDRSLSVTQSVEPDRIAVDNTAQLTVTVTLTEPVDGTLTARLSTPPGIRIDEELSLTLDPGEQEGELRFDVEGSVAGVREFDAPTLAVRHQRGFFTESLTRGPTPTLTVEARPFGTLRLGEDGQELVTTFGDHDTGRLDTGLEFSELREYQSGDSARRIDWKATARLDDPYVKKVEADTTRTMAVVFDHRPSMRTGEDAERKVDYAREVALTLLENGRRLNDPWGFYSVGEAGLTTVLEPRATENQYERIRTTLLNIEGTGRRDSTPAGGRSPASAGRAAAVLADDTSTFGEQLRPYFTATETYVERVATDPLFSVVDAHLSRLQGPVWTVLFTDETHRTELLETVKLARHGGNQVLVFLTPTVLYERDSSIETIYARYDEFETFKRTLNQLESVRAFEIGPDDRLTRVLNARRTDSLA